MSQHTYEHPVASTPIAGPGGEPCASCGAPLAADQRYCMHCGTRRPTARLDFLDVLAGESAPAAPPLVATPAAVGRRPDGMDGWLRANTHVLALAALVLSTLLIGLLVGHWATSATPTATAPAPQVIRISGAGQAAAPAAPATTSSPPATTGAAPAAPARKSAPAKGRTAKNANGAADVKKLSKKALDKAVKKGQPITTGSGAAPPKDGKPAGGGSSFQTIG